MFDIFKPALIALYEFPLLGQNLLALLVLSTIRHWKQRPFRRRRKVLHGCLVALILLLVAFQVWVSLMGAGYFGLITRILIPVLWGFALSAFLTGLALLWRRKWRAAAKAAILPGLLLLPVAITSSPFGGIVITPPSEVIQLDGELTIEVSLSLLSPPGHVLVSKASAGRPSGRSYTRHNSERAGPLTRRTFFMWPGMTKRLTIAADEIWCAPTDYPMTCPSGPGDYRITASLFRTPGASVGWPSSWPSGKLLTATSSEFKIRDGDADPYAPAARRAILSVLSDRFEAATFGAERTLTGVDFQTVGRDYCGRWRFAVPFLGEAQACIARLGPDGIPSNFDERDVRVDRFDLRVPEGMMTPREALVHAKRAMLAFGSTRNTNPARFKAPEYDAFSWRSGLSAALTEASPVDGRPSWQVDIALDNATERKISVLVHPDGAICIKRARHRTVYAPDASCELLEMGPRDH